MKQYRPFIKSTILCHNQTHLIAAALIHRGPCNDAPGFPPVAREAAQRLELDTLFADAAYDSEEFHLLGRHELGIRQTVFPINSRGSTRPPLTRYRRQMHRRFPKRRFGQRWQVESVSSQLKRLLDAHLRAHSEVGRFAELYLRILTFNLMILLRRRVYGFYRAI